MKTVFSRTDPRSLTKFRATTSYMAGTRIAKKRGGKIEKGSAIYDQSNLTLSTTRVLLGQPKKTTKKTKKTQKPYLR